MQTTILGRGRELGAIERFLAAIGSGPSALVITGPAGIGKTTLWAEAVAQAERRGYRVLSSRPAEAEAKLSYAAVSDLIGGVFDDVRAFLPEPQERALAVALLRAVEDEPTEVRTVATGFGAVLVRLAAAAAVVVAIDDVQWLDAASRRALEFAIRRTAGPVGILVAERADAVGGQPPLGLARALPHARVERMPVGPLSVATLHHVVLDQLGLSLPRPLLTRIAAASGGNPYFALELARSPEQRAPGSLGDPLHVPRTLHELVAAHVDVVSPAAREAALLAAALSSPTASLLAAAGAPETAVVEAEAQGIVVRERDRLRLSHPLIASVVYGSASEEERRSVHRRLAGLVEDPEERARHLALSASAHDAATAAAVEVGAQRASARGARDAAADLYAAAARLLPPERSDDVARCLLGAAAAANALGDFADARAHAECARALASAPALRTEILSFLAGLAWYSGAAGEADVLLGEAVDLADDERRGPLNAKRTRFSFAHDFPAAVRHAEEALETLREERDPAIVAHVLVDRLFAGAMNGLGADAALLERALRLEEAAYPHLLEGPQPMVLLWHHCVDDASAARARHAVEDAWYRERGEEVWVADRLSHLAVAELHAGRWNVAEELAEASCAAVDPLDVRGPRAMIFEKRALVDAHRGRIDRARSTLRVLLDGFSAAGQPWWEALTLSTLAIAEFAAGDHTAVDAAIRRMHAAARVVGAVDILFDRSEPFHVEALVALGDLDGARAALARLERRHAALPRPWTSASLPRTRALLQAAEGDVAGAAASLADVDPTAPVELPFEHACTLLAKGTIGRRAKQKRAAADALRAALTIFEELGARPWVERARGELDRVGLRRRPPEELTPSERRVAELVAAGLTNRQAAEAAFMSPKTVEANLARVYRKFGIRSRAELGARLARETRDDGAQM